MKKRNVTAILAIGVLAVAACGSSSTAEAPAATEAAATTAAAAAGSDRSTRSNRGHRSAGGATEAPAATEAAAEEVDYMWTPNAKVLAGAEGQVNVIAWAGYIESGETAPEYDWVTPFTAMTECKVNVKLGASSDEMVQLMQSGEYDGVSASGDATQRLMAGDEVVAIDLAEYSSYADIFDGPQGQAVELAGRQGDGHPPWPRCQPAGVQHRGIPDRSRFVGRDVGAGFGRRRHRLGVRQRDLHRRRRTVADGDEARVGHHQPVRPRPGPVRRRARRCSSRRRPLPASTGRTISCRPIRWRAARCSPAPPGRSSPTTPEPSAPRSPR